MIDTVYEWLGWALIAVGVIGCFVPVLPGPVLSYAALFVALAIGDHSRPTVACLVAAGVATAVVSVLDSFVPAMGAKKFHCTKAGTTGCFVGTFVGMFFLPLGVLLGPFLGALAGELLFGRPLKQAMSGAFGAFLGFMLGLLLKLACCGFIAYCFFSATHPAISG